MIDEPIFSELHTGRETSVSTDERRAHAEKNTPEGVTGSGGRRLVLVLGVYQ